MMIARSRLGGGSARLGLAGLAVLMVIFFEIAAGGFASIDNLDTILLNSSSLLIVGIAAGALLISGNVDLSIGGMLAVVSVVTGVVLRDTQSVELAVLVGMLTGVVLGTINGTLVRLLNLSPLIVTLGTASIYRGLAFIVADGSSIFGFPQSFTDLGRAQWLGTPMQVWIALAFFGGAALLLMRTVFGVRTFAIGGNPEASRLNGIPVGLHVTALYAFSGLAVALAAVLTTAQLGSASGTIGVQFELDVLTAVILGGVGFAGGVGRPLGILIGVVTIGIMDAGMIFVGLENFYQQVAKGAVLLLALTADQLAARRKQRGGVAEPVGRLEGGRAAAGSVDDIEGGIGRRSRARSRGPSALACRGLAKRYGPVWAVREVSFEVQAGEILCLLGDNGAGKSSVIKSITGVVQPDHGSIHVTGREVDVSTPAKSRDAGIAAVYQDLALCPNLGAAPNLVLGNEPRKGRVGVLGWFDFKQSEKIASERLGRLGVELEDWYRPVGSLSGGQRQSVAVARVATDDVSVVILDEPTAALGVKQSRRVLRLVRALADRGVGIILITHDVEVVLEVADRIVVLHLGEILFDGAVDEVDQSGLIHLMAGYPVPVVTPAPTEAHLLD